MFIRLYKWITQVKPRYFLSLDEKRYNDQNKSNDYRFKSFGEHTFPIFSYNDIIKNKNILYSINPYELIHIVLDHHLNEEKKNNFNITEQLRGNKYRLSNRYFNKVLSGEDICESPALLEKISSLNVYKIAYNTGFVSGRHFHKQLTTTLHPQPEKASVTRLKIITT